MQTLFLFKRDSASRNVMQSLFISTWNSLNNVSVMLNEVKVSYTRIKFIGLRNICELEVIEDSSRRDRSSCHRLRYQFRHLNSSTLVKQCHNRTFRISVQVEKLL